MKKEYICYVLTTDEEKDSYVNMQGKKHSITIMKINPNKSYGSIILGRRYHKIYCDTDFTTTAKGQQLVDDVIKRTMVFYNSKFYFI